MALTVFAQSRARCFSTLPVPGSRSAVTRRGLKILPRDRQHRRHVRSCSGVTRK